MEREPNPQSTAMDALLKKAMSGIEDDKSIVPKMTKIMTEEMTSFLEMEEDEQHKRRRPKS